MKREEVKFSMCAEKWCPAESGSWPSVKKTRGSRKRSWIRRSRLKVNARSRWRTGSASRRRKKKKVEEKLFKSVSVCFVQKIKACFCECETQEREKKSSIQESKSGIGNRWMPIRADWRRQRIGRRSEDPAEACGEGRRQRWLRCGYCCPPWSSFRWS